MEPEDRVGEAIKQTRLAREELQRRGDPEAIASGELREAHINLKHGLEALEADTDA